MAEEMLISAEESVMANFDFLSREGRFLMPYFSNIFWRKKNHTYVLRENIGCTRIENLWIVDVFVQILEP